MLKTNSTIDLLERSPSRINLPVKVKSPRAVFHRLNTSSSDIHRGNKGYKVQMNEYRDRKTLKSQLNKLFTLSTNLFLYSKKTDINLDAFASLNPHCISTEVMDYIQDNTSKPKTFREYIVSSYKSKSVMLKYREMLSQPEFIPKIKCQIEVITPNNNNNNDGNGNDNNNNGRRHLSKTPTKSYNKKSILGQSTMNRTGEMTNLQREKLALKKARIRNILSKSPSHTHMRECEARKRNNKYNQKHKTKQMMMKTQTQTNINVDVSNMTAYNRLFASKTPIKDSGINDNHNQHHYKNKTNTNANTGTGTGTNTSINASDNLNTTVKKLQVLKEQLAKMKTGSKEMYDCFNDNDMYNTNNNNNSHFKDKDKDKGRSNLPNSTNQYIKTEIDLDEDITSYNSKPLYSVLKGYLDEK